MTITSKIIKPACWLIRQFASARFFFIALTGTLAFFLTTSMTGPVAHALGNHPQASLCPADKPFYTFCSHSLHNLEGWFGKCHSTREQTQLDVENHARDQHKGNDRWTGILRINQY